MNQQFLRKVHRRLPKILLVPLIKVYNLRTIFLWPKYLADYLALKKASLGKERFALNFSDIIPVLNEATATFGFDRHYIYHPAWAMRHIVANKPEYHVDISSILSFSANLSAVLPVRFYDYRPADLKLDNLVCGAADLNKLPFADNEIKSLSCMHVVEHAGLGRYGDPLDYNGDLKAIDELKRVLAIDGDLFFVVPVGKPRIHFNAHRVYGHEQVLDYFKELELKEFALIPRSEDGDLLINPSKELVDSQDYGCGCYWFRKISQANDNSQA